MWKKLSKQLMRLCDICETIIALLVGIGIAATLITYLLPGLLTLFGTSTGTDHFLVYLEDIFNLVVGLEFMKMLFHISSDNIIEVLVILIARHMIIEAHGAMDIFLSTLSIALLLLLRAGLHWVKHISKERFHKEISSEDDEEHS